MKKAFLLANLIVIYLFSFSQNLRLQSDEKENGEPLWDAYVYFKMKLNGVYDINGGLHGQETFNLSKIDIWDDDNTPNFWMDMHQSQLILFGSKQVKGHTAKAMFEGDFWAGNNIMRLRKAYIEYWFIKFGQDWSIFGDQDIWPNVFDWDGPSSGIWRRDPMLIFFYNSKTNWKYELGFEMPGPEITLNSEEIFTHSPGNPIPDVIGTVKKKTKWGHLRLAAIYRALAYKENNDLNYLNGYGIAFSGIIKTGIKHPNPIQFQFVSGKGIATYLASFQGANYDATDDGYGNLKTALVSGGWISYEHWLNNVFHFNLVAGVTIFNTPKFKEFYINNGETYLMQDTDVDLSYFYGLVNIMADPFKDFTIGIEYNYGDRSNNYTGNIYQVWPNNLNNFEKTRAANRISFGLFYNF